MLEHGPRRITRAAPSALLAPPINRPGAGASGGIAFRVGASLSAISFSRREQQRGNRRMFAKNEPDDVLSERLMPSAASSCARDNNNSNKSGTVTRATREPNSRANERDTGDSGLSSRSARQRCCVVSSYALIASSSWRTPSTVASKCRCTRSAAASANPPGVQ